MMHYMRHERVQLQVQFTTKSNRHKYAMTRVDYVNNNPEFIVGKIDVAATASASGLRPCSCNPKSPQYPLPLHMQCAHAYTGLGFRDCLRHKRLTPNTSRQPQSFSSASEWAGTIAGRELR